MNYAPLEEKSPANINNNTLGRKHVSKALGIWLAVLIIASAFWFVKSNYFSIQDEQVFCTMEAKLCPDGSAVGRTGPKCEFAECPPLSKSDFDISGWKNYRNEAPSFEFRYPAIFEIRENGVDFALDEITNNGNVETFMVFFLDRGIDNVITCTEGKDTRCKNINSENGIVMQSLIDGSVRAESYFNNLTFSYYLGCESRRKEGSIDYCVVSDFKKILFEQVLSTFKFIQ